MAIPVSPDHAGADHGDDGPDVFVRRFERLAKRGHFAGFRKEHDRTDAVHDPDHPDRSSFCRALRSLHSSHLSGEGHYPAIILYISLSFAAVDTDRDARLGCRFYHADGAAVADLYFDLPVSDLSNRLSN